jgi:hypothetical protein
LKSRPTARPEAGDLAQNTACKLDLQIVAVAEFEGRGREPHGHQALRLKAGVHAPDFIKAAHQQTGAGEKNEGGGNLRHH